MERDLGCFLYGLKSMTAFCLHPSGVKTSYIRLLRTILLMGVHHID